MHREKLTKRLIGINAIRSAEKKKSHERSEKEGVKNLKVLCIPEKAGCGPSVGLGKEGLAV